MKTLFVIDINGYDEPVSLEKEFSIPFSPVIGTVVEDDAGTQWKVASSCYKLSQQRWVAILEEIEHPTLNWPIECVNAFLKEGWELNDPYGVLK